jgi:integrase
MPRNTGDCVERCGKNSRFISSSQPTASFEHPSKQHKTRTVEISPGLAGAINERREHTESEYLFANRNGKPNQHLLRDLQSSRHEGQSEIPLRIAEGAQDWGSRRCHAGVPLPTLTRELGHEPLAATEDYPVHLKKAETKKAGVDADSFPSPRPRAQDCKDEYLNK